MEQHHLQPQEEYTEAAVPARQQNVTEPAADRIAATEEQPLASKAEETAGAPVDEADALLDPKTGVVTVFSAPPHESEEATLPAMSPQEREAWMTQLRQQAHRQQRLTSFCMSIFWVGCVSFNLLTWPQLMGWISALPADHQLYPLYSSIKLSIVLCYTAATFCSNRFRARWNTAANDLGKSADLRAVGVLVDGLKIAQNQARDVLIPLLPRLQASDAPLLDREQRHILNRFLGHKTFFPNRDNMALVLAILKAYEQVGDEEAIPSVEKLAAGQGYGARSRDIREAAKACLPYLQQRAAQQHARQTLLRASGASGVAGENLLRAADNVSAADPQQLLRADNSE